MLNKTQNKGREPAGIYSKSRFFFNSFLYEPKAIWDTSRNWGEEKANKLFFLSIIINNWVLRSCANYLKQF